MTSLPQTMTAIEYIGEGGPEVVKVTTRPVPVPSAGEVLVRVHAAGVNRPDIVQRGGGYPLPPGVSDIPGLELAGDVVANGPDSQGLNIGEKVMALVSGGGYAEYCAVPVPQALPVPDCLDMVAASAIPETFFTVWTNVFQRGRLQAGESLLVHGGASGIGTAAIQLAQARGVRVFATAGSDERCQACVQLGAEKAINRHTEDFVDIIAQATDGRGVDVILDMVGGDYIARNVATLAVEGRLVFINFVAGSKVEFDFAPVMVKRATITGSTLRSRPVEQKGEIAAELRREVLPLLESRRVRPVVQETFPLEEAAAAQEAIQRDHIGKVVLTVL